jgi:hypothetical protein
LKDLILHFFTLSIERRTRMIMFIFQSLFSLVFSSVLYQKTFGPFYFININDYSAILNYILNGKLFICVFFFLGTWILFYYIGYYLILWLNRRIVDKVSKSIMKWIKRGVNEPQENFEDNIGIEIDKYLIRMGAIERKPEKFEIKQKGKNYGKYDRFTRRIVDIPTEEKYLLPYIFLAMLFQLNVIYFNSLSIEAKSWILGAILILALVIYLLFYFIIIFMLETFIKFGAFVRKRLIDVQ